MKTSTKGKYTRFLPPIDKSQEYVRWIYFGYLFGTAIAAGVTSENRELRDLAQFMLETSELYMAMSLTPENIPGMRRKRGGNGA